MGHFQMTSIFHLLNWHNIWLICFLDYPGLRTDDSGRILAHSILGSVDDFIEQAITNGDHDVSTGSILGLDLSWVS